MSADKLRPDTAPIRMRAVIEWDEDRADWGTLLPHQIAGSIASDEGYLTSLWEDEETVLDVSVDPAAEANRDRDAMARRIDAVRAWISVVRNQLGAAGIDRREARAVITVIDQIEALLDGEDAA